MGIKEKKNNVDVSACKLPELRIDKKVKIKIINIYNISFTETFILVTKVIIKIIAEKNPGKRVPINPAKV